MKTNSCGNIALHQMKLQTCRAHNMKACDHIYNLPARRIIPTEQSRADNDERWSAPAFLRMRRWANIIFELLATSFPSGNLVGDLPNSTASLFATSGKPSTLLPLGNSYSKFGGTKTVCESGQDNPEAHQVVPADDSDYFNAFKKILSWMTNAVAAQSRVD